MGKLIIIVYFLLFLIKLVKCDDFQEDDIKSTSSENLEEIARNKGNHNSNETAEVFTVNVEEYGDEPEHYDRSGRVKDEEENTAPEGTAIEETNRLNESPKTTIFVGSLANTLQENNDKNIFDDISVGRAAADSDQEESIDGADTGEIFVYTPNKKGLSQDPVLDLKARTGRVDEDNQAEKGDDDSNHDEASRMGHFPRTESINMRSGYVAPDDDNLKPPDQQLQGVSNAGTNGYPLNYPDFNHKPYPITNWKNKISPESRFQNSLTLFPPYESVKSPEIVYPAHSSREVMGQTNSYLGNIMKSYDDLDYPTRQQLFGARSIEMCSSCNKDNSIPKNRARSPEIHVSPDYGYRSSIQPVFQSDVKPLETANGRTVVYDPSAANNYPLQIKDHDENIRAQNSRSHEFIDPDRNGGQFPIDIDGAIQTKIGPLSKVLMNLPVYNMPRNNPLFRMNLGAG